MMYAVAVTGTTFVLVAALAIIVRIVFFEGDAA